MPTMRTRADCTSFNHGRARRRLWGLPMSAYIVCDDCLRLLEQSPRYPAADMTTRFTVNIGCEYVFQADYCTSCTTTKREYWQRQKTARLTQADLEKHFADRYLNPQLFPDNEDTRDAAAKWSHARLFLIGEVGSSVRLQNVCEVLGIATLEHLANCTRFRFRSAPHAGKMLERAAEKLLLSFGHAWPK